MSASGQYTIRPLGADTWDAYAQMLDKHHGAGFGSGCWCTWFHPRSETGDSAESGRACKERLVREGKAHAALVFDGDVVVAWCQFGTPEELPGIHHRKEYEANLVSPPDYRVTCIFVDRNYRREGVARAALDGAVDLIAEAGGGVVEGYPHDTAGKKFSATFLYNGTRGMYEKAGFSYDRPKGKNNCVMRKAVPAASTWIAPAAERPDPPYLADERARLDSWLDFHRATLLHKCAGLTGDQLAERPVSSSELSLLGLVRHMAANERIWFRIRFAREDIDGLYESPDHREGAEFALADPAAAQTDFATYRAEVALARAAVQGRQLDERFGDEHVTADLRWLYAHMIGEYARHNGHADMIRELLDGTTGR
jgi:GNAT superfamily N-acetyltransferase